MGKVYIKQEEVEIYIVKSIIKIQEKQTRNKNQNFHKSASMLAVKCDISNIFRWVFLAVDVSLDNCDSYVSDTGGKKSALATQKVL